MTQLLRPQQVTAAILAPAAAPIGPADRKWVRQRLLDAVPSLVEELPAPAQVVVTVPLLRQAHRDPEALAGPEEPFAWKPVFVRRSLGLSAVDACFNHRFSNPGEAVGPLADEAAAEWGRTGWRTFHWEPWMAALTPAARSVALAEAATWATALWSSLDWGSFARTIRIGGPDDQWVCTAPRTVRLKGRSELQISLEPTTGGGSQRVALVSVASGMPIAGWEAELGFLALAASLRSPSRPVPARVVGLWPDAGEFRSVDITGEILVSAADRVIACIAAIARARRSMVS
ncbi:MAG TPA: hypothetical protein VHU85_05930 [Acidimicrobiales bacterium]|jgi:hypothetical protein|nr:hypothetical protein [Acidimicrobiales bacterium]